MNIEEAKVIHQNMCSWIQKQIDLDIHKIPSQEKNDLKDKVEVQLSHMSKAIRSRVLDELFGNGPLTTIMADETITEIVINGPTTIYYEKNGQYKKHCDQFFSPLSFDNFIHRMGQQAHIHYSLDQPCANGRWHDFRVHLISPPLTQQHTHITLRRHPTQSWTFERLSECGWADFEAIKCLAQIVEQEQNILIIGTTGSGKTSCLNACLNLVGSDQRVIIVEDTDELTVPNHLSLKLLTRQDINKHLKDFNQCDLIVQSLRMRPQRLIVGEVRGGEAKDLLLALSTGHRGSLCSLHASHPHQALWRLEMLVQMGAPQWTLQTIRNLIGFSLDYIVTLKNSSEGRKLQAIHKIGSVETSGFTLEKII